LDGVALVVEHVADALDQFDILRPIVTTPAAALHRLDLGETRFPEAQHMLRQIEILSDLADSTKGVGALVHGRILTLDDDPACPAESGLISAVYEAIFKPGVMAAAVFNRAMAYLPLL